MTNPEILSNIEGVREKEKIQRLAERDEMRLMRSRAMKYAGIMATAKVFGEREARELIGR